MNLRAYQVFHQAASQDGTGARVQTGRGAREGDREEGVAHRLTPM